MKNRKIQLLIKALIPIIIISGCFGIEKIISVNADMSFNKPIVVDSDDLSEKSDNNPLEVISKESFGDIEGLTQNFGFKNDNEIVVGIGLSREEFYKKYPDVIDKSNEDNNKLLDEQYKDAYSGEMYTVNLSDLTRKPLHIDARDVYSDLSIDGDKLSYESNNKFYMYDLNNDSKTEYKDMRDIKDGDKISPDHMGNWSKDGKCLIYYEDGNLNVYNAIDNSSKSFKADSEKSVVASFPGYYSDNGQDIYFIVRKHQKNHRSSQGIFKLNTINGEVEETLVLPLTGVDNNEENGKRNGIIDNDYCVIEEGKRIIFNGIIEGIDGTYIYDVDNDKFYNVIPHIEAEEGVYGSGIWLSPDKTKVIYINLSKEEGKEQWNLYAAKINGNSLTDRICIYKNINLCGEDIAWSPDSKKILFFTANEDIERNYINFKDKNEINIVTFK